MCRSLAIPAPKMPDLRPLSGEERGRLSEANRDQLDRWMAAFNQWPHLRGDTRARLGEIGRITGTSYATARRYFDRLKAESGDAHVFIDWRKEKKSNTSGYKSPQFVEFCKGLAEGRQRATAGAWIELLARWAAREPIPGYEGHPGHPKLPAGWSRDAFYRWVRLTPREKAASRLGLSAAKAFQPLVYRTRRGMLPGQKYLADDVWHDFMVNDLTQMATGRPLEFNFLDVASAMKTAWGWRVRAQDAGGKFSGLVGRDFRFVLAQQLTQFGYRPDIGTELVLEHGTATIGEDLERLLFDGTKGQIRVVRGGMEGDPALIGQRGGRPKGNFRMKAALESLHNLIHNLTDGAPGQVGLSRDRRPEELHGLLKENDALMQAYGRLVLEDPQVAALIQFPLMVGPQCTRFLTAIYERMNARTEHALEGWDDYYVSEFRLSRETPWLPAAQMVGMLPEQQRAVLALIEADPALSRPRKMSPVEVWTAGARGLEPIDPFLVCAIIGKDLAKERAVGKAHMFEFEDRELGPGVHRYEAKVRSRFRPETWLPVGEKFLCFVNPFAADQLLLQDAQGRMVGTCPRIASVVDRDADALRDAFKRVARTQRELAAPANARRTGRVEADIARMQANVRLLRDAEVKPAREQTRRDAATLDNATAPDTATPFSPHAHADESPVAVTDESPLADWPASPGRDVPGAVPGDVPDGFDDADLGGF